jgi:endonuclease/exonuclease/phosphatase family metal-dependent hydrolase
MSAPPPRLAITLVFTLALLAPVVGLAQTIPLGDAVDAPTLAWTSGGSAVWMGQTNVTFDTQDSAASGAILDGQESWLETSVTGPGVVSFRWKVSSESSYDLLECYTNGVLAVAGISGEVDWQPVQFFVGAGPHAVRWRYVKDVSLLSGQDRGWVDQVSFATVNPFITTAPVTQFKNSGDTVSFAVAAAGTAPFAFQWQFEGAAIPAETNVTLTITNLDYLNAGAYRVVVSNSQGSRTSAVANLTVASAHGFSLLHYNVKGNGATDWTTNAAQVRAIARQLDYLNPDIVTFNEIPVTGMGQMGNWVSAFLPGYFLATNSTSDGFIQSAIVSRYPIARSQSWLGRVNLAAFGYNGPYTRDLFEAEIIVPGQPLPVHVFTTHLKAATDTTSLLRRAAETRAISNFLATVFLPTKGNRFYALTGDLNEDINRPPSGTQLPIQVLLTSPTGLQLQTPLNPFTGTDLTLSIQGTLNVRFDYLLPSQGLVTNLIRSQIFRTDLLPNPPAPLVASDSATASDHLPVHMEFRNPYAPAVSPKLTGGHFSGGQFGFSVKGRAGHAVVIEASTNLQHWVAIQTNVAGTGFETFADTAVLGQRLYRARLP